MPDRLTDEQIKELKKLDKEATPGPWDAVDQGGRFNTGAIRRNREDLIGKLDTLRDASLTVALRNAAPALLEEVEETRRILSAPRWSGLITSVGEDEKPATRICPGGYSAPDKDRAASAMLAALMDAARRGNIVAEERLKAVIAIAHAAGIKPTTT